jgi:drug/metabolite transporter (DMT)-like permease
VQTNKSSILGYAFGAFAAASYGMTPLFVLPLMKAGISTYGVLAFRYFFAIPMIAIMMMARGRSFAIRRNQFIPLMLMGFAMAGSSLTLYVAYSYIGASIASTLLFVYPILTAVIMAFVYKEKISIFTIFCILLAMSGIALLYRGKDGETLSLTGVSIVFLSALLYAVYLVACSRQRLKEIPTLKLTFYVILFGILMFLPKFELRFIDILNNNWILWVDVICLAFFPTALSLIATSAAIQRIGSTPVAILGALEPVTAVAIACTLFDEPLTLRLAVGIVLIILAVTFIIAAPGISKALVRVRKMFPRKR